MDIQNVGTDKVTSIQSKQEYVPKAKHTEFKEERGPAMLGNGALGRSMISFRGKVDDGAIPANATPDETIRFLRQHKKLKFKEVDLQEIKNALTKDVDKTVYLNKLLEMECVKEEEYSTILGECEKEELDNLELYSKIYSYVDSCNLDDVSLIDVIQRVPLELLSILIDVLNLKPTLSIEKATALLDLNIQKNDELQNIVQKVPDNVVNDLNFEDYADFKDIKDFYPRLEFLSTMIDQNTNLPYQTINSFPRCDDEEKVNLFKELVVSKIDVGADDSAKNPTLCNAINGMNFDYLDKDEVKKRLDIIEKFEQIKYTGSDGQEHHLLPEVYSKNPNVFSSLSIYSSSVDAFGKSVDFINSMIQLGKEKPELESEVQAFLEGDSPNVLLYYPPQIDYSPEELLTYIAIKSKTNSRINIGSLNREKINAEIGKADFLSTILIGDKSLGEMLSNERKENLKISNPESIKEFIRANEPKILEKKYDDWQLLIDVVQSEDENKIAYLKNNVLGDGENVSPENLSFKIETYQDYKLYTSGLKNPQNELYQYGVFSIYSSNLSQEVLQQKAKDAYILAGSGLNSDTVRYCSINYSGMTVEDKITLAKEFLKLGIDTSLLMNLGDDALEKFKLYQQNEFFKTKYSLEEFFRVPMDDLKISMELGDDDTYNNMVGREIAKKLGVEYAKTLGDVLKDRSDELENDRFAEIRISSLLEKFGDKPQILEAVLRNKNLSIEDLDNYVLNNYYKWGENEKANEIIAGLVSVANKQNCRNISSLVSMISSMQKDFNLDKVDVDGLMTLALSSEDKDNDIVEQIARSHIYGEFSLKNYNDAMGRLKKETIRVDNKEIPLSEYIPKADSLNVIEQLSVKGQIPEDRLSTYVEILKNGKLGYKNIPAIISSCLNNEGKVDKKLLAKAYDMNNRGLKGHLVSTVINNLKDNDGEFDYEAYKDLISKLNLSKITKHDVRLLSFMKFRNYSAIHEMSKVDKKEFLFGLLVNKSNIEGHKLSSLIPLLPNNDDGYAKAINQITQSLNMDTTPLNEDEQQVFEQSINNLAESLKAMDLSELSDVQMTMPHSEFISTVNEITKDLPSSESAKIQDYFGFKIVGEQLIGYPSSKGKDLMTFDITDAKTKDALDKVKTVVDNYTNNNFITTKDNPELNALLKEVSRFMPELFNQIDGANDFVGTIKSLQKVVRNPKFVQLSDSDKKVMILATLLHQTDKTSGKTSESAFDAYFIAKRFNLSDSDAQKLYKVVESSDLIRKFMSTTRDKTIVETCGSNIVGQQRQNTFDLLAFKLKEGNNFELAQMLYSSKEQDGLSRYLDTLLQTRIQQIKSNDFVLPQTKAEEYSNYAEEQTVVRDENSYNVKVVNSENIPDFFAFIHTPEAGYATGGSRSANFANFEIFKDFADDKVICTSYVTNGQAALVEEFHNGFIFDVDNDKQYVGYGWDIYSLSKNVPDMLVEYYGQKAGDGKQKNRAMVSDNLKEILYGKGYDAKVCDADYVKRLDRIKQELDGRPMTMENLEEIDPEFAVAYREFFFGEERELKSDKRLLNNVHHNEVLVSNPRISAIYTDDLERIPEEYLQKAQEENLPIVVIKT